MNARLLAASAVAATLACSSPPPVGPAPVSVTPDHGTGSLATDVSIDGTHFDPVVRVNFGSASQSGVDDTFHAYLQDSAGLRTELTAVQFASPERLTGTIPSGLSLGLYALIIQSPQGSESTLPDAYRVVTPVENVSTFRFDPNIAPPQRVGVPFEIGISAIDVVGRVVDGFTGSVTLRAAVGAVTPTTVGPFTLGRARVQVTLPVKENFQVLSVDGTGPVAGKTQSTSAFPVWPRLAQSLAFSSTVQSVPVGQCSAALVLEAREANGTRTQLISDLAVTLSSGGEGLAFFSNSSCSNGVTQVTLPAFTDTVTMYFRPAVSGLAPVRAVSASLGSAIQDENVP